MKDKKGISLIWLIIIIIAIMIIFSIISVIVINNSNKNGVSSEETKKGNVSSKDNNYIKDYSSKYVTKMTEDGVPIPKGFTYVTGNKETGVVIKDEKNNEFVWIPSTEKEYVKDLEFRGVNTNVVDDVLPNGIKDELSDVKKYGGFYIGRYETTTPDGTKTTKKNLEGVPTCQQGKVVWTDISYTNAKKSAEKMYSGNNDSVQSGLLTGKAWDRTCYWIEDYIASINPLSSLRTSTYYGNYNSSKSPADVEGHGEKQVAGYSEKWSTKNINDLAGNVYEFTNELRQGGDPVGRGGYFANGFTSVSSSFDFQDTDYTFFGAGFRIRLYIKID